MSKMRLETYGSRHNDFCVGQTAKTFLDVSISGDRSQKVLFECEICDRRIACWQDYETRICLDCGNQMNKVKK
jgi:hypothetical protein